MRNKSFAKLKYHVSLKKWISHDLSAHATKIMESHRRVERPQTSTYEMIKSTRPSLRLNKPVMRGLVSTDEWARRKKMEVRNLSLILLSSYHVSTCLTSSLAVNSNLQQEH